MTKVEITDNRNYLVNKREDLLLSEHRLSAQALKIMSCLICMVKKDDKDFYDYIFTAKDFKELTGTKSNNIMNDMVRVSNELLDKKVKINFEKDILLTHMVISAKYEKTKGSYLIFKIHPELKPFLLNLKKYLSYDIKNILALKSNYSIKLYELLKHKYNQQIQHKKNHVITFKIEIEEFREMFQVPKSYNITKICERILDKAKKEFYEKTDIFFEYKLNKKYGSKYDVITFFIEKN